MKVKNLYIIETKRIISEYNSVMCKLDHYNNLLAEHKIKINEMLIILDNIELSTDIENIKNARVNKLMNEYDQITLDLEKKLTQYIKEIEKLKQESNIVYQKIMTEYADVPQTILQEQIKRQLDEL